MRDLITTRFKFIKSKMTLLNYLIAIFFIAFAFIAPTSFFDESGPIEVLESLTLLLASTFCFIEYKKNREFKSFFLTCGFLLLIFVGREISWGRIFFYNEAGDIVKRKEWFLGPYIYYILAPFFIAVLVHAYKTKFVQNAIILLKQAPIMIFDFILIFAMIALSTIAEGHHLPASIDQLSIAIEESAEVAMYLATAIIINSYSRKNLLKGIKDVK